MSVSKFDQLDSAGLGRVLGVRRFGLLPPAGGLSFVLRYGTSRCSKISHLLHFHWTAAFGNLFSSVFAKYRQSRQNVM